MKVLSLLSGIFLGLLLMAQCDALKLNLNSPEDVCHLFPEGAVLRKPGSCRETIKCKGGKSFPHTVKCTADKIVSLDVMFCVADSTRTPDKYCTPTCTKSSPKYIQDEKNCNEWAECKSSKVLHKGSCPPGEVFFQAQQRCINEKDECLRTYDICNVAKTYQPFWDKRNCHKYYYCNDKRKLISANCPIETYYDANIGMCLKKTQVDCHQIPVPDKGCGTKKLAIYGFVSDQSTCRGYFYCKNLGRSSDGNYIPDMSPDWNQCPPNEFFDAESKLCQHMDNMKCNEDRCDGRSSGNILSEKSGCQHYLVCRDGYTVDEVQCQDNKFFDPVEETCVGSPTWYSACD